MGIRSEWDRLMKVVIHRPGPEIEYAMLSPRSFLFERPFSTSLARKEHLLMEDTLKGEGIEVIQLRDIFIDMAEHDSDFRKELEKKVENTVMFFGERDTVSSARDDFSRNLHELDPETLFAMMTLEPSLDLRRNTEGDLNYPTIYSNVPLANLYFMRDQQAVLTDGVAIGRMRNVQRRKEINITMGKFAIFGTGSRTNVEGVRQVLQSGLIDFDRVYVVQNPVYDFMEVDNNPMINMHLDTYFNVPSSGTVISNRALCERSKGVIFSRTDAGYEETGETTLMNII
ncbi:MAG: arginine deiminase family protein, partial [Candidatus Thermoplasmatota archaeon]|nr:arginine deiminase family protein [Candidatus Thermoplasmatota archaeon]